MASNERKLEVVFLANTSGATKGFQEVGDKASGASKDIDKADKSIRNVGDSSDGVGGKLSRFGGALGDIAKIAGGFVLGAGLTKLPGFFEEAAQGAADDEAATARLNQTLQNLVDRHAAGGLSVSELKARMDEAIASGQKLAFTDDEIRDSMGYLLNATDDVNAAQARQTAAMDLARGAHIDLQLATRMLGKMSEDNVNTFKKLGIELPKTATEMDALRAVQERFGGQAETFANENAGKWEQFKIRMSEAKETIGYGLLPVVTTLGNLMLDYVAPAVETVASKVGDLASGGAEKLGNLASSLAPLAEAGWDKMADAWGVIGPVLGKVAVLYFDGLIAIYKLEWKALQAAWEVIEPLLKTASGYAWDKLVELANVSWEKMQSAWESISDRMGAIPWGKVKAEASDSSNWAAAIDKVKSAVQPAIDVLKPLAEDALKAVASQFSEVTKALGPFFESLKPLQPILKPLAEVIGVVIVGAIALLLIQFKLFTDFTTTVLVAAINTATATIKGITAAFEFVTGKLRDWLPEIGGAFGKVWDTITSNVKLIVGTVSGMADDIVGFFTGLGPRIVSAIEGIIPEIVRKAGDLVGKVTDVLDPRNWKINPTGLQNWMPFYLDKGLDNSLDLLSGSPKVPALATAVGDAMRPVLESAAAAGGAIGGAAMRANPWGSGSDLQEALQRAGVPDWAADWTKGYMGAASGTMVGPMPSGGLGSMQQQPSEVPDYVKAWAGRTNQMPTTINLVVNGEVVARAVVASDAFGNGIEQHLETQMGYGAQLAGARA